MNTSIVPKAAANAVEADENHSHSMFEAYAEAQAEREQLYEQLQAERQERLANRNLDKEPFLGQEPTPEAFVQAIAELLDVEADRALLHHVLTKWNRQYKDDIKPVFCDYYFRRNKVIRGKKLLERASFSRLIEAGLLRKVRSGFIGDSADLYEPTEDLLLLYESCCPKSYEEYINLKLVNPLTGRLWKRPQHQLKGAPDCVRQFAESIGGVQVDLMAIWAKHREEYEKVKPALEKHPDDRTADEASEVGRYLSNRYNLLGIRINGFVQLPGGDVILQQAWGYTYPGRLKPLNGGFLNLSREYREIGLASCAKEQWVHDLKAAQVNILLEMADKRGITLHRLEKYASNKRWREFYADKIGFGCTAKIVKTAVLSLVMQVAAPHPNLIKKRLEEGRPIKRYSFVTAFTELGGLEAYQMAYKILEPIIKETRMMASVLYKECKEQSKPYKGQLWAENAIGMRRAFWNADGSPAEGMSVAEVKRELNAFLLQGREQQVIHTIAKEHRITGYEHDGFIATGKVTWRHGRVEVEGQRIGRDTEEVDMYGHSVTEVTSPNTDVGPVSANIFRGTASEEPNKNPYYNLIRQLATGQIWGQSSPRQLAQPLPS